MKRKRIIAIDPGSTGALVYEENSRIVECRKITGNYESVSGILCEICATPGEDLIAFVEDVGKHVAGNRASSSIKLARNHQNIKTTLWMLGIETVDVSPQKWTKTIGVQVNDARSKEEKLRVRNLPKAEKDRENGRIREAKKDKKNEKIRALLKETGLVLEDVTKYSADAYGIYMYAKKTMEGANA